MIKLFELFPLTCIYQPGLWPVWHEHPSCLSDRPWCPPEPHLGYHSRRWPVADLNQHKRSNFNRQHKTWNSETIEFITDVTGKNSAYFKMSRHILIQFLTLSKLCWLVRSNINRKPIASLKKAVVRLRNLQWSRTLYLSHRVWAPRTVFRWPLLWLTEP